MLKLTAMGSMGRPDLNRDRLHNRNLDNKLFNI